MKSRAVRTVLVVAAVLVAGWAARELALQLRSVDVALLRAALVGMPRSRLVAVALCTLMGFAALGLLEVLACRAVLGDRLAPRRAFGAGVVAHALCNALGAHAVLAPATRLALYRGEGVDAWAVTRVLVVVGGAVVAGSAMVALVAVAAEAVGAAGAIGVSLALAAVAVSLRRLPPELRARMPEGVLALAPRIACIAIFEAALAIAALYVLMPAEVQATPSHFALAFVGAAALGVASHSPGGVGVFEAAMLAALPGDRTRVLVALLVFRIVYNLLPAALGGLAFVVRIVRSRVSSTAGTRGSRGVAPDTAGRAPMRQ